MSKFTDEDGIDGPFEKAMARATKQDQLHGSSIWYPHEKAKAERYRDWHRERGHKAKVFKRFIRVGGFHIEVYVAVVWVKKKQTKEELLASLEGDK